MPKFTVTSAIKERDVTTDHGVFVSYLLALKDESGADVTAKLLQKPETPVPSGELNGHVEQTNFGPKFVKERVPFGGIPGKGPTPFSSRTSPEDRASIERQVSLKAAVELGCAITTVTKKPFGAAEVIQVAKAFDGYLKNTIGADKPGVVPQEALTDAEAPQDFPPEEGDVMDKVKQAGWMEEETQ